MSGKHRTSIIFRVTCGLLTPLVRSPSLHLPQASGTHWHPGCDIKSVTISTGVLCFQRVNRIHHSLGTENTRHLHIYSSSWYAPCHILICNTTHLIVIYSRMELKEQSLCQEEDLFLTTLCQRRWLLLSESQGHSHLTYSKKNGTFMLKWLGSSKTVVSRSQTPSPGLSTSVKAFSRHNSHHTFKDVSTDLTFPPKPWSVSFNAT